MYDALVIGGFLSKNHKAMEDLRLNSTLSSMTCYTGSNIRDQAMTYMMYKVGKYNVFCNFAACKQGCGKVMFLHLSVFCNIRVFPILVLKSGEFT